MQENLLKRLDSEESSGTGMHQDLAKDTTRLLGVLTIPLFALLLSALYPILSGWKLEFQAYTNVKYLAKEFMQLYLTKCLHTI
mmetsp:Transcript_11728/g.37339  ORF Transcript_11728/g.37339 Transcript_11728/m.37339 type:complete len:83 (-) Transcript_11728:479-727(-)